MFFFVIPSVKITAKEPKTLIILFLYIDSTIMSSSIPAGRTWLMTNILPSIKGTFVVSSDKMEAADYVASPVITLKSL